MASEPVDDIVELVKHGDIDGVVSALAWGASVETTSGAGVSATEQPAPLAPLQHCGAFLPPEYDQLDVNRGPMRDFSAQVTLLMAAAAAGHTDLMSMLIEHGARLKARDQVRMEMC